MELLQDTRLPPRRAAAQLHTFRLQASAFPQDGLDLEVDLVGDLWSQQSCQEVFTWEEAREA